MLRKTRNIYPQRPVTKARAIAQQADPFPIAWALGLPISAALWYGLHQLMVWLG